MVKPEDVVSRVKIFGLEDSVAASKYPFATDVEKCTPEITKTTHRLARAPRGSGEDTFMHGIIVQFDLTLTTKAWVQAERYHFLEFISSESQMHKLVDFDIEQRYIEYVDHVMINRMKELLEDYHKEPTAEKKLVLLYSNPQGFRLTARMTTNYQQLKTIYAQRKAHFLPEWRAVCEFFDSLPLSSWITNKDEE